MNHTETQMSMNTKRFQKLRLVRTDDTWWGSVGNKSGVVGMDNGGCEKPSKEAKID